MMDVINRRQFIKVSAICPIVMGGSILAKAEDIATPTTGVLQDVYTFLVLGLDTRPDGSGLNTDVIRVSRIDLNHNTVRTMPIPRDLYVEIPGAGQDKINVAFASVATNGKQDWPLGAAAARKTIEQNFGVEIDGVLSIRFEGAEEVIDLFGGVTVENPYDLSDDAFPTEDYGITTIFYAQGTLHLSGAEALEFMRTRHQDGDEGRVMRQNQVLDALLKAAQEPETATKLPKLFEIGKEYVMTDIPMEVQLQLLEAVPNIPVENVTWGDMTPLLWGDVVDGGAWVYEGDWDELPEYVQAFLNGDL